MHDYQDFSPPLAPLADAPDPSAELADRGSRLAAKCLDGLTWFGLFILSLLLGITSAVTLPALMTGARSGRFPPVQALNAALILGSGLVLGAVALIVWNCVWLHRYGQTVGKRAAGIRIVRTSGERASLGRIFALRFLPMALLGAIPGVGFLISLTDTLIIFRDSRQCLHDQIADTKVVKYR